ncbi:MAG: hypothetical protein Ct9H300mP11_31780 [Chloroflexota bacterium]|nr:MAG: hypothetical protein Ct9H300mP11_31780 [Chloroflexota bacterium]
MTSTPVKLSNVRILRPSRPMRRPFISSFGKETVEVVASETTSVARRLIATVMILRAFGWPFLYILSPNS